MLVKDVEGVQSRQRGTGNERARERERQAMATGSSFARIPVRPISTFFALRKPIARPVYEIVYQQYIEADILMKGQAPRRLQYPKEKRARRIFVVLN